MTCLAFFLLLLVWNVRETTQMFDCGPEYSELLTLQEKVAELNSRIHVQEQEISVLKIDNHSENRKNDNHKSLMKEIQKMELVNELLRDYEYFDSIDPLYYFLMSPFILTYHSYRAVMVFTYHLFLSLLKNILLYALGLWLLCGVIICYTIIGLPCGLAMISLGLYLAPMIW
eukprot:TRINITY_DN18978_c0_g1_i1.p1 TRINITY_DN18978_c0_g1~~TRINITY_DN18978_c0_g1_i1.p1  ORF type:complete len:172 (+),score=10.45 TRINITY_DN18978_c0_g1_i1:2-517(+)